MVQIQPAQETKNSTLLGAVSLSIKYRQAETSEKSEVWGPFGRAKQAYALSRKCTGAVSVLARRTEKDIGLFTALCLR